MLKAMKPDRVQWVGIGLVLAGLCLGPGEPRTFVRVVFVLASFAAGFLVLIGGGALALVLLVDVIALPKTLWVAYKTEKKRARDAEIAKWLELNWEHPMRPELVREYREKFGRDP